MRKSKSHIAITLICILAIAVTGLQSCSEEEEFITSPNGGLSFSQDTISFDTIFTDVGSATKEFKVYNSNSKGVRLTSVRLGSNGSSGFRINLDGNYATQFTDVEICHEDSMFCFVEVTVNPHNSDSPTLVTDSILFTMENGMTQKVMLEAYGQDVIVMSGQTIRKDTTLASVRPIVVRDSLVVAKGATLTIAPGTTICFHKYSGLSVYGTLKAEGTQDKPITMRGDRTDKLFTYLPYDRLDAQWKGIRLYPESHDNSFNYCDIHGGNYGIIADNDSLADGLKYTVHNCKIHNVAGDAIFLQATRATLSNTQLSNAGGNCATIIGGTTEFTHCTLAQFYPWNATHGSALYFANVYNSKEFPLIMIKFANCIITGSSTDEVYGSRMQDSDAAFNYQFYNSLVNTVTTEADEQYFIDCKFDREEKKSGYGSSTSKARFKGLYKAKANSLNKAKANSLYKANGLYRANSQSTDNDNSDGAIVRGANFRTIDNSVYFYDFRLDSLSAARGLGDASLTPDDCKVDMNGVKRPANNPDAGCYQYEKE